MNVSTFKSFNEDSIKVHDGSNAIEIHYVKEREKFILKALKENSEWTYSVDIEQSEMYDVLKWIKDRVK